MKSSRRNYYRTLQVQPDAPLDTIKNNYRTLLHTLRLHPDLGGDNHTASAINLAYATLRSPSKRAAYDRKLLLHYKIEVLSKGHFSRIDATQPQQIDTPLIKNSNQRNYYRILHIQPDAPAEIILSSYQMLLKKQGSPIALIKEAYSVLSDSEKRHQYNLLLKKTQHIKAIGQQQVKKQVKIKVRHLSRPSSHYQPSITHYCNFCKTPQNISAIKYVDDLCIECSSPLYSSKEYLSMSRRFFSRTELTTTLNIYTSWPSNKVSASLSDLSPTGLCFLTKQSFNQDQIIKIDTDQFLAVGQVKYQKKKGDFNNIGIEFITIQFNAHQGTFVSTSA